MASTEHRAALAAAFIQQAPPGQVNDVINDIRTIIASDDALMPYVLPKLRAYNLEHFHTVQTSLLSEAAILNGSGTSERYVDPRAKQSFAFDHVSLLASDHKPYHLPEPFESFRASLDKSLQAYTKDHFPTGVSAVFSSANHVVDEPVEDQVDGAGTRDAEGARGVATASAASPGVVADAPDAPDAVDAVDAVDTSVDAPVEAAGDAVDTPVGDAPVEDAAGNAPVEDGADNAPIEDSPVETAPDASAADDAIPSGTVTSGPPDAPELAERSSDATVPEPLDVAADDNVAAEDADAVIDDTTGRTDDAIQSEPPAAEPTAGDAPADAPGETLPEVSNPVYTIQIVGNRYNPQNFWTGRWRSQWIVDPAAAAVSGSIKVDVHYYEQGNVQLATSHKASFPLPSGDDAPSQIITTIAKLEAAYQLGLNDTYNALGDKAFKSLRRALPVTRQKVEWEKISGYKLGTDLKAA